MLTTKSVKNLDPALSSKELSDKFKFSKDLFNLNAFAKYREPVYPIALLDKSNFNRISDRNKYLAIRQTLIYINKRYYPLSPILLWDRLSSVIEISRLIPVMSNLNKSSSIRLEGNDKHN